MKAIETFFLVANFGFMWGNLWVGTAKIRGEWKDQHGAWDNFIIAALNYICVALLLP